MTKEELKEEAEDFVMGVKAKEAIQKQIPYFDFAQKMYIASAEPREKRIAELEEKISVLLSCKNCPENKGGYICEKEYENKCLSQKIQYIKELQKENAELKVQVDKWLRENTGLKIHSAYVEKKLTEAKDLIRNLLRVTYGEGWNYSLDWKVKAEQFLKEIEK